MASEEKHWLECHRSSHEFIAGVNAFFKNVFATSVEGSEMRCPCTKCRIQYWHKREGIYNHLICNGPSPTYAQLIYDVSMSESETNIDGIGCEASTLFGDDLGMMLRMTYQDAINCEKTNEGPHKGANAEARKFYRLLEEGKQALYPGCLTFSALSFLVKMYHVKSQYGMTESCFTIVMKVPKLAFPHAHVPKSFNHAKNTINDLGLDYQKIDAFPNNCCLYWGANESDEVCKNCGSSRWKIMENDAAIPNESGPKITNIPAKVMRYFLLKPRLQRMFMSMEFSQLMTWHAEKRKNDGKLRHAADGESWKAMDANYPQFSAEKRNVKLGLAADGFNPFCTMTTSHSTWPIVLVNYNLPPWLTSKAENMILSTLIPGPDSPGNNIDVYMQPLITELKDLWSVGIETYDVTADETFTLHACVMWTISDFPGNAMVSGYSTKGFLACPACHYETTSMYLSHNKKICYMGHKKFLCPSHRYRFDKKMIFMSIPPSFFDVMIHLQVHLCKEIELGGPVRTHWMFPIEQYLGKLKSYVRNRSKPEPSIAEGYLAEESLTFCSRFFGENEALKASSVFASPNCSNEGFHLGRRKNKDGETVRLDDDYLFKAHRYILFNSGNKEIETLIEDHRLLVDNQVNTRKYDREREHTLEFSQWLKEVMEKRSDISKELVSFAEGPKRSALRFSGYVIHGYRFHTKQRDARCTTQNSGVYYSALTTSFSSSKDKNPIVGNVDYYGEIEEIIELDYWGVYEAVLFRCTWYQEEKCRYGLTRVNFNKLCQKNDPFVMATQVQQVFYVADPIEKGMNYVVKQTEIESHPLSSGTDYGPE